MTYAPKTSAILESLGISEATVRARGQDHAAFSAAQLARGLGRGPAAIYRNDSGDYAYGVKSQNTGGVLKPKGDSWRREAEVFPSGKVRMSSPAPIARMDRQVSAIDRSKHLSPEEKLAYAQAAERARGKRAVPRELRQAVQQAVHGVKLGPAPRKPSKAQQAATKTGRALDWLRQKVGLAKDRGNYATA